MRCMDGVMAFPFILLSIILSDGTGDGIFNVILAIGIAVVPRFPEGGQRTGAHSEKEGVLQCRQGHRHFNTRMLASPYTAQ